MALFPNFAERPPADRYPGSVLLNNWEPALRMRRQNPSGRVMPAKYFMFLETPPGQLSVRDAENDAGGIFQDGFRFAIGFR